MDPNEMNGFEPVADTPAPEAQPAAQAEPAAEIPPIPEAELMTEAEPGAEVSPEPGVQPVPEGDAVAPTQPEKAPWQPWDSAYSGEGVGRKESPYANSPYYTNQSREEPQYTWQPEPPKPPKQKKERKGLRKKVIAAGLAVALVAGSCGITAALVNNRWENEVSALENKMSEVQAQLIDAQTILTEVQKTSPAGNGVSVSGTVVSQEGMTPAQVYAQNVNSVVAISNYMTYATGWGYGSQPGSSTTELAATGSGFIISEDGYVMTNYHVVEDADRLTFTTYLGEEYEAELVGFDELNDVALLKAEATGLDPVELGSSDELIIGDMVVAIGNPLGELTSTQTVGYVSGKDRSVSTDGSIINMLQTDAAINSGNSGGPLFNMRGQVIGITTAKYSGDSGTGATIEGIGFAIPIDDVISMIDDFKEYGYLRNQAYLGVMVRDLTSTNASEFSLPSGAYVTEVNAGSSAQKAGVQVKDIIIGLGDQEVGSMAELTAALRRYSAGDTTTITVYRGGQELELRITFDEKPADTGTDSTVETFPGEMPQNGSYDEWYDYFAPYFGFGG